MKAKVLDLKGNEKSKIDLPEGFSKSIREDILSSVLEAKKSMQPYAPSALAGRQHSAQGQLVHRRHVWKSQYGRGMSRIPRKILMSRGSQFHWEGANVPNTKDGRRAHPPKTTSMIKKPKINKKTLKLAFESALSATASPEKIKEKYQRLQDKDVKKLKESPFIVESKLSELKTKELLETIKNILGEDLFEISQRKESKNSGKGKSRGRKKKKSAGLLIVKSSDEKFKTKLFETRDAKRLNVEDLAKGGPGRITLYTEKAINELNERIKGKSE